MNTFFSPLLLLAGLLQVPAPGPARQAPTAKPALAPAPMITWSAERRLTLADFQARAPMGSPLSASTSSNIKADAACKDYVFSSTVVSTFDPNTSWFRNPKMASENLLRHEQLHFDITEVYTRIMRQRLQLFAAKANCEKLQPGFNNTTKLVYADWDREQNRYDQETNHGLNAVRQAAWEKQTAAKLDMLKPFAQ
ncbi:hypothetical protein GCM10022409_18110 [Hymenobacter glaciei]|uniref:DUF922 domain-containing protein n=1 Tax=Hymenobacter glaciei TaxID=877209 RepID=A0ABP7U0T7_9BACT